MEGNSDVHYFQAKTGTEDHKMHIDTDHTPREFIDDDETVGLVAASPTPMVLESVPECIRVNDDVIIDNQPARYYRLWKMLMYFVIGFVFLTFMLLSFGYFLVATVFESVEITNFEFQVGDINDDGINLNLIDARVHFGNLGIFNWVNNINGTKFQFVDNIVIGVNNNMILELQVRGREMQVDLSESVWKFELCELQIEVQEDPFADFVKKMDGQQISIDFAINAHGTTIPVHAKRLINSETFTAVLDKAIDHYLSGIKVQRIDMNEYDHERGVSGAVTLLSKERFPVPGLNLRMGLVIDNEIVDIGEANVENLLDGDLFETQFTVYNVDQRIIDSGVADDIIYRALNNDTHMARFPIVIKGVNCTSRTNLWFCSAWENLNITIGIHVHKISHLLLDNTVQLTNKSPVEIEEIAIDMNKAGNLQFSSNILTSLVNPFEIEYIDTNGTLSINGARINVSSFHIDAMDEKIFRFIAENVELEILDLDELRRTLEELIYGNYDNEVSPLQLNLNISTKSSFLTGLIHVEGIVEVHLADIVHEVLSRVEKFDFEKTVELQGVTFIEGGHNHIAFGVEAAMTLPSFISEFNNDIHAANVGLSFENVDLFDISVDAFKSIGGTVPFKCTVVLLHDSREQKVELEEFIGEFISGLQTNVTLHGSDMSDHGSLFGCNNNTCEMFQEITFPLAIDSSLINGGSDDGGGGDDGNYFIRDTVMHIMSKEVEMTLFNPILNKNIIIEIEEAEAICEGYIIGYLRDKTIWEVEPGEWKSPRARVEYANTGSAGWKIIERAVRGDGTLSNMTVRAVVRVTVANLNAWPGLSLLYESRGKTHARVRW